MSCVEVDGAGWRWVHSLVIPIIKSFQFPNHVFLWTIIKSSENSERPLFFSETQINLILGKGSLFYKAFLLWIGTIKYTEPNPRPANIYLFQDVQGYKNTGTTSRRHHIFTLFSTLSIFDFKQVNVRKPAAFLL